MLKIYSSTLIYVFLAASSAHASPPSLINESVSFENDNGEIVPVISTLLIAQPTSYEEPKKIEYKVETPPTLERTILKVSEPTPNVIVNSHFIYPDESYFNAINRWLQRDNIDHLAWSIDNIALNTLNQSPIGVVSFNGSITDVIPKLSRHLGVPFYLSLERYHLRAAIHQWHNREVQIVMVGGTSLKETIKQLTLDYNWKWIETPTAKSWLATHDYPVSIDYPIVTPEGDLKMALRLVLEGYPVSARLLESSYTLFIVDTI